MSSLGPAKSCLVKFCPIKSSSSKS